MTPQKKMETTLGKTGIPYKHIHCYGSQIMITAWSEDAARKWASLLAKFCETVRPPRQTTEETKDASGYFKANPGLVKSTFMHDVWRVWGTI